MSFRGRLTSVIDGFYKYFAPNGAKKAYIQRPKLSPFGGTGRGL